jgi:hypothetical protein
MIKKALESDGLVAARLKLSAAAAAAKVCYVLLLPGRSNAAAAKVCCLSFYC